MCSADNVGLASQASPVGRPAKMSVLGKLGQMGQAGARLAGPWLGWLAKLAGVRTVSNSTAYSPLAPKGSLRDGAQKGALREGPKTAI